MTTTITARRLITESTTVDFPVLTLDSDGSLLSIDSDPAALAHETTTLTSAFLDIHTHGALSHDVMRATPTELSEMQRFLAHHGVAHYLPTTVTASIDDTLRALDALATAIESTPQPGEAIPIGIHLEGPFLSHLKRGVHAPAQLQPPSIELFDRFQNAARGHIVLLTIAPELLGKQTSGSASTLRDANDPLYSTEGAEYTSPGRRPGYLPRDDGDVILRRDAIDPPYSAEGAAHTSLGRRPRYVRPQPPRAVSPTHKSSLKTPPTDSPPSSALELIRYCVFHGIKISLGHSNATAAETLAAVTAGATSATHTFNAMRAIDHREPGIAAVVLTNPALFAELICDGIHVDPVMVQLWLNAKGPNRAILVTDAMSATGMPDGTYSLAGFPVTVANGRASLTDNPSTLAGSVLTMDRAVANLQRFTQSSLATATRLASHTPAAMLGLSALTQLTIGSPATFNRFDHADRLIATTIRGHKIP